MSKRTGRDHISVVRAREAEQRRDDLVKFIRQYTEQEGWPPTRAEMCARLRLSVRAVEEHLAILRDEGRIDLSPGRGVRIAR